VYVESSGLISIYKNQPPHPGLGILPYNDEKIRSEYQTKDGLFACTSCGNTIDHSKIPSDICELCGSLEWIQAVY